MFSLCLNSPGGHYEEGLAIARYLLDDGRIATIVEAGAECYSACALIFMAGSALGYRTVGPSRWLNINGKLGFHSAFYKREFFTGKQFTGDQILKYFREGQETARLALKTFDRLTYNRQFSKVKPWVRTSLFMEMWVHEADTLLMIDNVDKAGRWGIDIFGHAKISTPTSEQVQTACTSEARWYIDLSASVDSLDWKPFKHTVHQDEQGAISHRVDFGLHYPPQRCVLYIRQSNGAVEVSTQFYANADANTPYVTSNRDWSFFSPRMLLRCLTPKSARGC